jgi:hypothetical protein
MGKKVAFVLNQCPPTPRSSRSLEAAAGLRLLGVLADPMMSARADFQDAMAAGLGVTEYAPEGKAAQEAKALWDWVKKELRGSHVTQTAVNLWNARSDRGGGPAGGDCGPGFERGGHSGCGPDGSSRTGAETGREAQGAGGTEDRKPHDVIMEGVDLVLAKYGFPSLAEFKKGKKR